MCDWLAAGARLCRNLLYRRNESCARCEASSRHKTVRNKAWGLNKSCVGVPLVHMNTAGRTTTSGLKAVCYSGITFLSGNIVRDIPGEPGVSEPGVSVCTISHIDLKINRFIRRVVETEMPKWVWVYRLLGWLGLGTVWAGTVVAQNSVSWAELPHDEGLQADQGMVWQVTPGMPRPHPRCLPSTVARAMEMRFRRECEGLVGWA